MATQHLKRSLTHDALPGDSCAIRFFCLFPKALGSFGFTFINLCHTHTHCSDLHALVELDAAHSNPKGATHDVLAAERLQLCLHMARQWAQAEQFEQAEVGWN